MMHGDRLHGDQMRGDRLRRDRPRGLRLLRSIRSAVALILYLPLYVMMGTSCDGQARYAATGPGSLVSIGGMASGFQIDYGKRILGGAAVYVDLNPTWRYGIEGEARRLRLHQQAETNEATFLVGPRLSFGKHRLNPYAKVLAGLGRFNFPYGYASGSYFVLAPGGGVDLRLSPHVRLRLIDVEYQDWPQFSFGALHPYGVSAGISFTVLSSSSKRSN